MKRIDPVIFEEQDAEEILKPLTLSLAEKQQQTNRLLSILGLNIPSIDQTTDQLIDDLENKKKLADEANVQTAFGLLNMKVGHQIFPMSVIRRLQHCLLP